MSRTPCARTATPVVAQPVADTSATPVLRTVFERSLVGTLLLVAGPDGPQAAEVNPAAAARLGGTVEGLTGPGWSRALEPDDRDRLHAAADELLAGEADRRQEGVTLPGGRRVMVCLCTLVSEAGTPMVLAQLVDCPEAGTLSSVGPELRTPISSVLGYTELLRQGVAGSLNHQQAELVDRVRSSGRRLLDLVEGLLTLDRVGSDHFVLEPRQVAMDVVVRGALGTVTMHNHGRDLSIRARVAPEPLVVPGDGQDLERVVVELLANAVKFTPPGGRITLELTRDGSDALVAVEDTGLGIPAHDRERLFDRFFRTSTALERAVPGTGIGLAIVRSVVDAHGGSVRVSSPPGQGARFEVRLPLATSA